MAALEDQDAGSSFQCGVAELMLLFGCVCIPHTVVGPPRRSAAMPASARLGLRVQPHPR